MSNNTPSTDELREQMAEALGLEKGGITKHDSPANEHYYFVNVVEDLETEQVVVEQHINFEEELDRIMTLFDQALIEVEQRLCNKIIKELNTYTAGHDQAMRDEAIYIVKEMQRQRAKQKGYDV